VSEQDPGWFEPGGRLDVRRAVVALRSQWRRGVRRARTSLVPVLTAAVGAAISWQLAVVLFNQPAPMFAPMACWICLGFTRNRAPRAVAELGLGATVGVAIGELFARAFGAGAWQIGTVLVVCALLGRLLDRGTTFTMQSVGNGVIIVGMAAYPVAGGSMGRWADALVGGAVAFLLTVALPRTVAERPRRYARSALEELAVALEMLAPALRTHDIEAMRDARQQMVAVREAIADWDKALQAALDVAGLNPRLRSEQPDLDELKRLLHLFRRAQTSLTMIVRQSIGFSEQAGDIPGAAERVDLAAAATRSLAAAVGGWHRPARARLLLQELASHSSPADIETDDWRPAALMALMRAFTVDLLQMTGLSRADANAQLAATHGAPYASDQPPPPEDETSALWGGD